MRNHFCHVNGFTYGVNYFKVTEPILRTVHALGAPLPQKSLKTFEKKSVTWFALAVAQWGICLIWGDKIIFVKSLVDTYSNELEVFKLPATHKGIN